jgi:hypothetical protein
MEENTFMSAKIAALETRLIGQGEQLILLSQQINMMRQRVNQLIAVVNDHTIKLAPEGEGAIETDTEYAS